jgi:hypothetical protein
VSKITTKTKLKQAKPKAPKEKKSSTKTQPAATATGRKVQSSTNKPKQETKKMSANLKANTVSTSSQKKTHALSLVKQASEKQQRKHDSLAPYREQAAIYIKLYFGKNTPAFVRDVISSWLTRMETETQIFWNQRAVLEVALPLMLREAERMGVGVDNPKDELCLDALHESIAVHQERHASEHIPEEEESVELDEQEITAWKARAVFDLIQNPEITEGFKDAVSDILDKVHPWHTWETFRVAWPLALRLLDEEKKGEGKGKQ